MQGNAARFTFIYLNFCLNTIFLYSLQEQFQAQAENMLLLIEGKNKQAFGTTYQTLKDKITEIINSGYFDKNAPVTTEAVETEAPVVEPALVPANPPPVS